MVALIIIGVVLSMTVISGSPSPLRALDTDAESETSGEDRAAPGSKSQPLSSGLPDPSAPHASEAPSCLTLRFDDPQGTVELQLLLGDAATRLEDWHARHGSLGADSVFLDGFDPKKAEKGSIRADFADSIDANAVHGSDAPSR